MIITANHIAGLASLALAALPLAALPTTAHAEPARVATADLDLNTPEGVVKFNQRAEQAANQMCTVTGQRLPTAACKKTVLAAFAKSLDSAQQKQMATGGAKRPLTTQ